MFALRTKCFLALIINSLLVSVASKSKVVIFTDKEQFGDSDAFKSQPKNKFEIQKCESMANFDSQSSQTVVVDCELEATEIFLKKHIKSGGNAFIDASRHQSLPLSEMTLMKLENFHSQIKFGKFDSLKSVLPSSEHLKIEKPVNFITTDFDNLATFPILSIHSEFFNSEKKTSPICLIAGTQDKKSNSRAIFSALSLDQIFSNSELSTKLFEWLEFSNKLFVHSIEMQNIKNEIIKFGEEHSNVITPIHSIEVHVKSSNDAPIERIPDPESSEFYIRLLDRTLIHLHPQIKLSDDKSTLIFSYKKPIDSQHGVLKFSFRLIETGLSNLWQEEDIVMVPEYIGRTKALQWINLDLYLSHIACFLGIFIFIYSWLNIAVSQ